MSFFICEVSLIDPTGKVLSQLQPVEHSLCSTSWAVDVCPVTGRSGLCDQACLLRLGTSSLICLQSEVQLTELRMQLQATEHLKASTLRELEESLIAEGKQCMEMEAVQQSYATEVEVS